jgi:serine/threonine-protein kinase
VRFSSSDSLDEARFIPGTLLADRYRIIALLGKGGMGEVYRADDMKLAQPVALKFLPETLAMDGAALARFHREVRIARQVAHPNVCRVFDIGEVDGHHFLSMEYIDGEDLSSLIRRIGRVPIDKAIEIARQLCAGLAAAHESGVLHRDLKPANVMIDGRGKARITVNFAAMMFALARLLTWLPSNSRGRR